MTFVDQAYDNRLSFFRQSLSILLIISCHLIESVLSFHQNQTPLRCEGMGDLSPQARTARCNILFHPPYKDRRKGHTAESTGLYPEESIGQLVALGFDVAVFTPAPYQRPGLGRPL